MSFSKMSSSMAKSLENLMINGAAFKEGKKVYLPFSKLCFFMPLEAEEEVLLVADKDWTDEDDFGMALSLMVRESQFPAEVNDDPIWVGVKGFTAGDAEAEVVLQVSNVPYNVATGVNKTKAGDAAKAGKKKLIL